MRPDVSIANRPTMPGDHLLRAPSFIPALLQMAAPATPWTSWRSLMRAKSTRSVSSRGLSLMQLKSAQRHSRICAIWAKGAIITFGKVPRKQTERKQPMTISALLPHRREKELLIEQLPGETVIYDTSNQKAHCLNPVASLVWQHCDGRTCVEELAA